MTVIEGDLRVIEEISGKLRDAIFPSVRIPVIRITGQREAHMKNKGRIEDNPKQNE